MRHSVFVIGNAGTGKSQVMRSLQRTYQNMKRRPVWADLNPKAVTNDELFGIINPATREWKDGDYLLPILPETVFDEYKVLNDPNVNSFSLQACSPILCVNWPMSVTADPSGLFWMETLTRCGLSHSTRSWMTTRCERVVCVFVCVNACLLFTIKMTKVAHFHCL